MNQRFKLSKSNARIRDMQLAETYLEYLNTQPHRSPFSFFNKGSRDDLLTELGIPRFAHEYLEYFMGIVGPGYWRVKDLPTRYVTCPVCKERIWIC